jgi:hypothetical protein
MPVTERPAVKLTTWCVVLIGPDGAIAARLSPSFDHRQEARSALGAVRSERGDRKWVKLVREELHRIIEDDDGGGR